MRNFLLFLFAAVSPAYAQDPVIDPCAVDVAIACPVEIVLPGLGMANGDPVVTGPDTLTFVVRDQDEPEQASAVDVSLTDGRILRKIPLGVAREDTLYFDWLIAPERQGYLVFVWENKRDRVLVFFDADGVPRSRMPEIRPQGWPYELTMASSLMLLARQNLLTFDGEALYGRVGRFDLRVTAADARMTAVEHEPASGGANSVEDEILGRVAVEVAGSGAEAVHRVGNLSVATIRDEFGVPTRLVLRSDDGGERVLDQPPEPGLKNRRSYFTARLSPDGRYLAVVRGARKNGGLIIMDTTTGEVLYLAQVRGCWSSGLRWLPDGRIARLCFRMRDGIEVNVFDPRLPP